MSDDKKISHAAKLIKNAKYAIALTGAGVSTSSGIPDFRSPGSGLWEKVDPMSIASFWNFMEHPQAFYEWVRPFTKTIMTAQPNPAHRALAELEELGRIHAVITQNIDNLHQRAGSKRVLEVHGHMRQATCIRCFHMVPAQPLMEKFVEDGMIPICEVCGSVMKPNIVLYGEMLPVGVMHEADLEVHMCDTMLIAGSSLEVIPAADLPLVARKNGANLIIVNDSPTPIDLYAAITIRNDVSKTLPKIVDTVKKL